MKENNIVVIMPSYLKDYPNGAKNRPQKFIRAVNSFVVNNYQKKHMVIVSDGCEITNDLFKSFKEKNIHLVKIEKQSTFSGVVRQSGIDYAIKYLNTDVITYLDSDDMYGINHLKMINEKMQGFDWIYYPDYLYYDTVNMKAGIRSIELCHTKVGTSNISHKILDGASWDGCDGYGHDWIFIQKLMALTLSYKKVETCQYFVMHVPGKFDN